MAKAGVLLCLSRVVDETSEIKKKGQNICVHDRFGVKLVGMDGRNIYYLECIEGPGIMANITLTICHDPCQILLSEQAAGYA